ncbi:MAG: hypothetical protein EHM77_06475 [Planctomycetaceae bacterium]|nr:MAG: hypothetical protein EHM77_06475 [Planctomycetaceae bacterium]
MLFLWGTAVVAAALVAAAVKAAAAAAVVSVTLVHGGKDRVDGMVEFFFVVVDSIMMMVA